MPAYNAGKYLSESIKSVLAQTYADWELIIVDDESQDDTASIVESYQRIDSRIKYFWQKNGKQGRARNKAIRESEGYYLAFLDADDIWLPHKLTHQVNLMKEHQSDLVFGYSCLLENGLRTEKTIGRGSGNYQGQAAIEFLLYHDAFIMSTVFVKREAVMKVECFVEDLKIQYCEDWHLWLKLALENFSFYTDTEIVSYYRIHSESAAITEKQAQIKFFFALLNLHHQYRNNLLLTEAIRSRIDDLMYHSVWIDEDLVDAIVKFLRTNNYIGASFFLYKPLYRLNLSLFRKFFLGVNKIKN